MCFGARHSSLISNFVLFFRLRTLVPHRRSHRYRAGPSAAWKGDRTLSLTVACNLPLLIRLPETPSAHFFPFP